MDYCTASLDIVVQAEDPFPEVNGVCIVLVSRGPCHFAGKIWAEVEFDLRSDPVSCEQNLVVLSCDEGKQGGIVSGVALNLCLEHL